MPLRSAVERAERALARIEGSGRPEVWISRRPPREVLDDARRVDRRVSAGELLPLAGVTVAVKDNIDVEGMVTTAGCPAFAYRPARDAIAVARLRAAGAVVVGKTNLDQFATGLVGTRSPYGAVRDARRPGYASGGSSSGSAVAVALGMADLGLATDTAGSGRIPAAFQGIVGIKPTQGLIPTGGVVPACPSFDCVSLFSGELALGRRAAGVMARQAGRSWPPDAPLAASRSVVVALARELPELDHAHRQAYAGAAERLAAAGHELLEIDVTPCLEAGRLLYGGAFVAERHAAVGAFIERNPGAVDPVVREIILAGGSIPARALVRDRHRLSELRGKADRALGGAHMLLLPTTTRQPHLEDVAADPVTVNAGLGLYASWVNLLDRCAVAVPAGRAGEEEFGVTLVGAAFADALVGDVAADMMGEEAAREEEGLRPRGLEVFVAGAHRRGQPLNPQLTCHGARFRGTVRTVAEYRMHRLETDPPKPGLVRVREGGVSLEGELWELPREGFAAFVAALAAPMALGRVRLEGGACPIGFLCEPAALAGMQDISEWGSWPAYLAGGCREGERGPVRRSHSGALAA